MKGRESMAEAEKQNVTDSSNEVSILNKKKRTTSYFFLKKLTNKKLKFEFR